MVVLNSKSEEFFLKSVGIPFLLEVMVSVASILSNDIVIGIFLGNDIGLNILLYLIYLLLVF